MKKYLDPQTRRIVTLDSNEAGLFNSSSYRRSSSTFTLILNTGETQ
jgi:hypothetical protein